MGATLPSILLALTLSTPAAPQTIPTTDALTLDGRSVTLPNVLSARATVLILGFGRHSSTSTTAWEKPVRLQLAQPPVIGFYDIAVLAEVPGFVRPIVTRAIKNAVPEVLRPNFLTLSTRENEWKRVAGYTPAEPDAAYVLLVDRSGHVRWSTHEPFSEQGLATLKLTASQVAHEAP